MATSPKLGVFRKKGFSSVAEDEAMMVMGSNSHSVSISVNGSCSPRNVNPSNATQSEEDSPASSFSHIPQSLSLSITSSNSSAFNSNSSSSAAAVSSSKPFSSFSKAFILSSSMAVTRITKKQQIILIAIVALVLLSLVFFYIRTSDGKSALSFRTSSFLSSSSITMQEGTMKGYKWPWEKLYVINLDRRAEKWNTTRHELAKAGIKAEDVRFSAIDGSHFTADVLKQLVKARIIDACNYNGLISRGAVGNYMSFKSIFEDAVDKGFKQILIMEDDVHLHPEFHDQLWKVIGSLDGTSWDVLYLSLSPYKREQTLKKYNDYVSQVVGDEFGAVFGAIAVIYNERAIKAWLKYGTFPQRLQSDILLGFLVSGKNPNVPKLLNAYYAHAPQDLVKVDLQISDTSTGVYAPKDLTTCGK